MNVDAVVIGVVICVIGAVVVLGALAVWAGRQIKSDQSENAS